MDYLKLITECERRLINCEKCAKIADCTEDYHIARSKIIAYDSIIKMLKNELL